MNNLFPYSVIVLTDTQLLSQKLCILNIAYSNKNIIFFVSVVFLKSLLNLEFYYAHIFIIVELIILYGRRIEKTAS